MSLNTNSRLHKTKELYLILVLALFTACKSDKDKQNEKFVALIENADINSFIDIEYISNDSSETYNYFVDDVIFTSWQYNSTTKLFENYDLEKMMIISPTPLKYMEVLRNKIKSLNVNLISQTQWPAQALKFWTSDTEYFTYVHPDFKFDSSSKTTLENELKNAKKVKDNWYYTKMIVCTND